jgi:hypothetical protein
MYSVAALDDAALKLKRKDEHLHEPGEGEGSDGEQRFVSS